MRGGRGRLLLWGLALVPVIALVVAEATRPVAPALPLADPSSYLTAEQIDAALAYRRPLRPVPPLAVLLRAGAAVAAGWLLHRRLAARPVPAARWRRVVGAGAVAAVVWAVSDLVRLPLQLWLWRRSVAVGLSTQDLAGWLRDYAVSFGLYWLGVGLAVAAGVWLAERLPRTWVPVAGLVGGGIGVVLALVSPLVFEPLLLSFEPLPHGELREEIVALVEATGQDVRAEVLVADASRRTTASNAYVSGLGATRRIVLYDTLLADAPREEVLAIVAHELAHDVNGDLERGAVGLAAVSVLLVAAVAVALRLLLGGRERDGSGRVPPATAAVATAVAVVLLSLGAPAERAVSRRAERAADAGALALTGDGAAYEAMMAGLAVRNLSDPAPPTWYTVLFGSHPPTGDRITRARAAQEE